MQEMLKRAWRGIAATREMRDVISRRGGGRETWDRGGVLKFSMAWPGQPHGEENFNQRPFPFPCITDRPVWVAACPPDDQPGLPGQAGARPLRLPSGVRGWTGSPGEHGIPGLSVRKREAGEVRASGHPFEAGHGDVSKSQWGISWVLGVCFSSFASGHPEHQADWPPTQLPGGCESPASFESLASFWLAAYTF